MFLKKILLQFAFLYLIKVTQGFIDFNPFNALKDVFQGNFGFKPQGGNLNVTSHEQQSNVQSQVQNQIYQQHVASSNQLALNNTSSNQLALDLNLKKAQLADELQKKWQNKADCYCEPTEQKVNSILGCDDLSSRDESYSFIQDVNKLCTTVLGAIKHGSDSVSLVKVINECEQEMHNRDAIEKSQILIAQLQQRCRLENQRNKALERAHHYESEANRLRAEAKNYNALIQNSIQLENGLKNQQHVVTATKERARIESSDEHAEAKNALTQTNIQLQNDLKNEQHVATATGESARIESSDEHHHESEANGLHAEAKNYNALFQNSIQLENGLMNQQHVATATEESARIESSDKHHHESEANGLHAEAKNYNALFQNSIQLENGLKNQQHVATAIKGRARIESSDENAEVKNYYPPLYVSSEEDDRFVIATSDEIPNIHGKKNRLSAVINSISSLIEQNEHNEQHKHIHNEDEKLSVELTKSEIATILKFLERKSAVRTKSKSPSKKTDLTLNLVATIKQELKKSSAESSEEIETACTGKKKATCGQKVALSLSEGNLLNLINVLKTAQTTKTSLKNSKSRKSKLKQIKLISEENASEEELPKCGRKKCQGGGLKIIRKEEENSDEEATIASACTRRKGQCPLNSNGDGTIKVKARAKIIM